MYKRRIKTFLILIAVGVLLVVVRLGQLQIIHGKEFRQAAEKLLLQRPQLPGSRRGCIFDRTGKRILAMDKPCFDFCLDYRLLTGEPKWTERQKQLIERLEGVSHEQAEKIFQRRVETTYRLVQELSEQHGVDLEGRVRRIVDRVQAIRKLVGMRVRLEYEAHPIVTAMDESVSLAGTIGAEIRRSKKRWYPYGAIASHVIGLAGQVNLKEQRRLNRDPGEADWLTRLRANYLTGDIIGKSGVEKMSEEVLRGRHGYRRLKRNSGGMDVVGEIAPQPGRNVRITLDIELQQKLTELLQSKNHNGVIVVLSVGTGEVLGLVSVPVFDLNRYRTDRAYNRSLNEDTENFPLRHRAVSRRYPPGSTVKPLVALGALSTGLITPSTTIECLGFVDPSTPDKFRCWIYTKCGYGHGPLDLLAGTQQSCNVYFYRLAEMLGARRLGEWFKDFGFADVPGTGLPGEVHGLLPLQANRRFSTRDAWLMGIGQGPVSVTPLHVANAMATIARGGELLSPRVLLTGGPEQIRRKLRIRPEHIDVVKRGMWKVVNEQGGTAWRYFQNTGLGVEVCGKTGTADEPSRGGDMGWFAGFAPYRDPQIAFAVVVEYVEGGGAANAAPIAIELVRLCEELGYIQ